MSNGQRTVIAALQVSLDGYVEAPEGDARDWVDSWADALELLGPVDAFVLGRGMFDGRYEAWWDAALADPDTPSAMFGRAPYPRDVEYARRAHETPHIVLGGPGLVATLMHAGLIDELRLISQPVILGGGKPLFGEVRPRHPLALVAAAAGAGGRVDLTYRVLR